MCRKNFHLEKYGLRQFVYRYTGKINVLEFSINTNYHYVMYNSINLFRIETNTFS